MQENYLHLTKRHHVLMLFHGEDQPDPKRPKDWVKYDIRTGDKTPDHEGKVIAKFNDDITEEVFYCQRAPCWWYVNPKNHSYVIQEKIIEWRYL